MLVVFIVVLHNNYQRHADILTMLYNDDIQHEQYIKESFKSLKVVRHSHECSSVDFVEGEIKPQSLTRSSLFNPANTKQLYKIYTMLNHYYFMVLLGLNGNITEGLFLKNLYCLECILVFRGFVKLKKIQKYEKTSEVG